MRTVIYGLFDDAGICLYVGRTGSPKAREKAHKQNGCKFTRFKILKRVFKKAKIVEGVYIRKYKAIGQAELNTQINTTQRLDKVGLFYVATYIRPEIKQKLENAARRDHRTVSSMLRVIIGEAFK